MPNVEPQELPIAPPRRPQGWPTGCSNGTCVDIEPTADGERFRFFSTIPGNEGQVEYTPAEVAAFLADVKAGRWNAVQARAEALARSEAVSV